MEKTNEKGVKEFLDVLKAIEIAGVIAIEQSKDGFQWTDLYDFFASSEFRSAWAEAVKDIDQVPAEIMDLSGGEIFDISQAGLNLTKNLYLKWMQSV